jgi:hypothetical protein
MSNMKGRTDTNYVWRKGQIGSFRCFAGPKKDERSWHAGCVGRVLQLTTSG